MKKAKTLVETKSDGLQVANILTEQESEQEEPGLDGPEESNAAGVPDPKPFDPRVLPEFRGRSERDYYAETRGMPFIEALNNSFLADYDNARLLPLFLNRVGLQFTDRAHLRRWLAYNSEQEGLRVDRKTHAYTWTREPDAPTYTLDQKRTHLVYETGGYIFLKLPHDKDFIRREGVDMSHCLSTAYGDYCERMIAGQIEVYSQTEIATGKPVIDIEVALTKPSYNKPVTRPTVTQIRGPRNQLPPDDRHLPALMDFLTNYGGPKGWQVTGHHVVNFDGRADGDVVMARWKHLQNKGSA